MHKALLNAETKDFYSIIADVVTPGYPNGFKSTLEVPVAGIAFDNDGGGLWTKAIKIPLTTTPSEYAQYKIVIQSNTMQIYAADGTLKAEYGAQTGVASDFWYNVKSDGSDIRVANQNYQQLYFWIEQFDYANSYAVIWVKVEAGTSELYIAYGNPSALPSAYNDGTQVFEEFTDYETQTEEGWTVTGGAYSINTAAAYHGNYGLDLQTAATAYTVEKTLLKTLNRGIVIEFAIQNYENAGQASHFFYILDDEDNGYGLGFVFATAVESRIYRTDAGTDTQIGSVTGGGNLAYDTWYYAKIVIKSDGTIIMSDGKGEGSVIDSTYSTFTKLKLFAYRQTYFDYIRVYKLADPADFGTAETITLTTTGDFTTVTFDFPEGVDKLLITVDTDATAVYYSTDDGATWNPIQPDTETLLPSTAYSIKWKFEFASYVRGYAFITW